MRALHKFKVWQHLGMWIKEGCWLMSLAGASYSFSPSVGGGSGTSFSLAGNEKITAVRLYEAGNAYISGSVLTPVGWEISLCRASCWNSFDFWTFWHVCFSIQLQFGGIWTKLVGRKLGTALELDLADDEHIIQVSEKEISRSFVQCRCFKWMFQPPYKYLAIQAGWNTNGRFVPSVLL